MRKKINFRKIIILKLSNRFNQATMKKVILRMWFLIFWIFYPKDKVECKLITQAKSFNNNQLLNKVSKEPFIISRSSILGLLITRYHLKVLFMIFLMKKLIINLKINLKTNKNLSKIHRF